MRHEHIHLDAKLSDATDLVRGGLLQAALAMLAVWARDARAHMRLEEDAIFPQIAESTAALRRDHVDFAARIEALEAALIAGDSERYLDDHAALLPILAAHCHLEDTLFERNRCTAEAGDALRLRHP